MLAGYTPFYSEDPMDTYKKVGYSISL
jgi:hypothetical protein